MQRIRIFNSALTGVKYVFDKPITFHQYLALSPAQQRAAHSRVQG